MDVGFRAREKLRKNAPRRQGGKCTAGDFGITIFFVTTISERYCVVIDLCLNKLLYLFFYKPIS